MNKSLYLLLGAAAGAAAIYLFLNPEAADKLRAQLNTGNVADNFDNATGQVHRWGTKQRVTGTGTEIFGKAKQGVGQVFGDDSLQAEGVVDQVKGAVKDTAGQAAHAAVDAIHDATR